MAKNPKINQNYRGITIVLEKQLCSSMYVSNPVYATQAELLQEYLNDLSEEEDDDPFGLHDDDLYEEEDDDPYGLHFGN